MQYPINDVVNAFRDIRNGYENRNIYLSDTIKTSTSFKRLDVEELTDDAIASDYVDSFAENIQQKTEEEYYIDYFVQDGASELGDSFLYHQQYGMRYEDVIDQYQRGFNKWIYLDIDLLYNFLNCSFDVVETEVITEYTRDSNTGELIDTEITTTVSQFTLTRYKTYKPFHKIVRYQGFKFSESQEYIMTKREETTQEIQINKSTDYNLLAEWIKFAVSYQYALSIEGSGITRYFIYDYDSVNLGLGEQMAMPEDKPFTETPPIGSPWNTLSQEYSVYSPRSVAKYKQQTRDQVLAMYKS